MAETRKEELKERLAHQPKIQINMPRSYGVPTAGGKFENDCLFTGLRMQLTADEWEERYARFRAEADAERLEQYKAKQAEEKKKHDEYIKSLPTKQRYIQGAQKAKMVLGRNKLLGVILRNHDVKIMLEGGKEIIIPACARETDRDFTEVMLASTYIRVIAVCPWMQINWVRHWWLVKAKWRIWRGKRGPIVEIAPGAGLPRRGEGGEACNFIDAEWCMLEYPDPDEQVSKFSPEVSGAGCATDGEKLPGPQGWLAPLRRLWVLLKSKGRTHA